MIGSQATGEPHHLNVAPSLALKSATGLEPIEVAVDVQLQQGAWMIAY